MKKYVFVWQITDEYTYWYQESIPFQCQDIEVFILDSIDKVKSSEWGCEILGVYVRKDQADELYNSFLTLEDWFSQKEFKL